MINVQFRVSARTSESRFPTQLNAVSDVSDSDKLKIFFYEMKENTQQKIWLNILTPEEKSPLFHWCHLNSYLFFRCFFSFLRFHYDPRKCKWKNYAENRRLQNARIMFIYILFTISSQVQRCTRGRLLFSMFILHFIIIVEECAHCSAPS